MLIWALGQFSACITTVCLQLKAWIGLLLCASCCSHFLHLHLQTMRSCPYFRLSRTSFHPIGKVLKGHSLWDALSLGLLVETDLASHSWRYQQQDNARCLQVVTKPRGRLRRANFIGVWCFVWQMHMIYILNGIENFTFLCQLSESWVHSHRNLLHMFWIPKMWEDLMPGLRLVWLYTISSL